MHRYSCKHIVDMNSKFNVNTTCATGIKFTSQRVSPRKSVVSVANKEFIEETDKNFDFITEIPFRFLGVGDFKVSIVIEN